MSPEIEIRGGEIGERQWEEFVGTFESANVFHSPGMAGVFSSSKGFEPFPVFALSGGEIVAAAFPVLVRVPAPVPRRFATRCIMYASPLYRSGDAGIAGVERILRTVESETRWRSMFLEIRNSERFPAGDSLRSMEGFEYIPYQNYTLDLRTGTDGLWRALSSYTRNHVRKSEKKGALVRELRDSELDNGIELIRDLYKRKKVPLPDRSLFTCAYSVLKPLGGIRAIGLEVGGKIVAVRIALAYRRTVYDWYAASQSEFNGFYPNEALVWDTLRWGCEKGYHLFDFGGGAVQGEEYGPAAFKEKFRGTLVEYGRYRRVYYPWIYSIADRLYRRRVVRPRTTDDGGS
jgi:serine/alanine adding enzyme